MRFLIIFIVLISAIMIVASFFLRYLRKIFGIFSQPVTPDKHKNEKGNVIYEKDDIIVLKGDAGKPKDQE